MAFKRLAKLIIVLGAFPAAHLRAGEGDGGLGAVDGAPSASMAPPERAVVCGRRTPDVTASTDLPAAIFGVALAAYVLRSKRLRIAEASG
jgi:hypothetical protein